MFDEHLLQYRKPGQNGECELIVGLDFGTSASKVVVQAPEIAGGQAYAVNFSNMAHSSMACLLPTRLWITPNGTCSLAPGNDARLVKDIKVMLIDHNEHLKTDHGPAHQRVRPEVAAVAYLALLL